jgi:hypothetical protein
VITPAQQRTDALQRANVVRLQRADDKRHIGAVPYPDGLRRLASLVTQDRNYFHRTTAYQLLQWPKGMGPERAHRICQAMGLREGRAMSWLTARQREEMAYQLVLLADDADRRRAAA